jgi:hypothetical protein
MAAWFPQGLIGAATSSRALDRRGEAIYAGLACPPACPHPEAIVHNYFSSLRPIRHGPARPGHLSWHRAGTGGSDKPGHDGTGERQDGTRWGQGGSRAGGGRRLAIAQLFLLSLALTGCHLLDQTDFEPRRPPPPVPPPIPDTEARPALLTIEYTKANPDYATTLATAVHAVETRRPGSLYDVVAVVADAAGAEAGRARAAEVMTAIEAAGVIPASVQLGLLVEPGRKPPQVRVYLR